MANSNLKYIPFSPYYYKLLEPELTQCPDKSYDILKFLKENLSKEGITTNPHLKLFSLTVINCVIIHHKGNSKSENKLKRLVTDLLCDLLKLIKLDEVEKFLFFYRFLLGEIYDQQQFDLVAIIDEEYKLAIIRCVMALINALTWDVVLQTYTAVNAPTLSSMFLVLSNIAKNEKFITLRIAAIECLMCMLQVSDDCDFNDIEMRNQVSKIVILFTPGILSTLVSIATENETCNHRVISLAICAVGRITAIQFQNYNSIDHLPLEYVIHKDEEKFTHQNTFKSLEEVTTYIENTKRTSSWYKFMDQRLEGLGTLLIKLCNHSNPRVKLELLGACVVIVETCSSTCPKLIGKIFEIAVILSNDEDTTVNTESRAVITKLTKNCSQSVYDHLEENFFKTISNLSRVFTGLDCHEQINNLNLLIGYLKIFGKNRLGLVLRSVVHLERLIQTLMLISKLENKNVNLLHEYMIQDLELVADHRTPWKNFFYFSDNLVKAKLELTCAMLAKCNVQDIMSDMLIEMFINVEENRKEITFILNSLLSGISGSDVLSDHLPLLTVVFNTYLDPEYWNLPLEVGYDCMMPQVQNNVIQICLQIEGIGQIALILRKQFKQFLYQAMYAVLERAGSGNALIKAAGTTTIANIALACGYSSVTEMIIENSDYFSYHVTRRLQKSECTESVLNVLAVVIKYSDLSVLNSISHIMDGVLLQSCDKFFQQHMSTAYLRLFQMFLSYLINGLNVQIKIEPIKSKVQKQMEHDDFIISNIDEPDSDDDEEYGKKKTPEEMYEKYVKNQQKLEEDYTGGEEYQAQKPPLEIELAASILQRCVHFMPSKNRDRKILVLQIFIDGLELIRNWEDTLLPLVHQIWSPLVERFKELDEPLVVNYSFQLLVTLARLSKDFIRSRTVSNVLPNLENILKSFSKSSYLKDRGSAYRYTQAYKLQLHLLQHLGRVVTDLDLPDESIKNITECVILYLNNRQPIPLQEAALNFFNDILQYDEELVKAALDMFPKDSTSYNTNIEIIKRSVSD